MSSPFWIFVFASIYYYLLMKKYEINIKTGLVLLYGLENWDLILIHLETKKLNLRSSLECK